MALIQIAFEIISMYRPLEIPIKSELKKISNIKKSKELRYKRKSITRLLSNFEWKKEDFLPLTRI